MIRLPLRMHARARGAARRGRRAARTSPTPALRGLTIVQARLRRAQARGDRLRLHARLRGRRRGRASLARHARDPHVRPAPDSATASSPRRPPTSPRSTNGAAGGRRLRPVRPVRRARCCAQMGLAPDRPRARQARCASARSDTWGLWRRGVLDPESNVQFGEGGAGTFSDGKLWSQISDPRHLTRKVLDEFVKAGAPRRDPLRRASRTSAPSAWSAWSRRCAPRSSALGGEIRFEQRVDRPADRGRPRAARAASRGVDAAPRGEELRADHVVLALGHSARDTFAMLHERGVRMRGQAVLDRLSHRASAGR